MDEGEAQLTVRTHFTNLRSLVTTATKRLLVRYFSRISV